MEYLSKDQVKTLLENRPEGVDANSIVKNLTDKGFILEGLNDSPEEMTTLNVGTGFTPKVEATGQEGLGRAALNTVRNIPRSAAQFGKDIVGAVSHPVQTAKSIYSAVEGAGGVLAQNIIEKTDIAQNLLKRYEQETGKQLPRDENGVIQAAETPETQMAQAIGEYFQDRYGGTENLSRTVQEDPVGFLSDLAGALSGGATITSKAPKLAAVSGKLSSAARITEPANILTKIGGKVASPLKKIGTVVSEGLERFKPTEVKSRAIVNNLGITRGELVNINELVRRTDPEADIATFVERNNIDVSKNTEPQKVAELENLAISKANERDALLSNNSNIYTEQDAVVSRINQVGQKLADNLDGIGNEADFQKAMELSTKKEFTLKEINEAKQFMSKKLGSSMFKEGGQPKGGLTQEGLRNVYSEIRTFVENESGSPELIRELNNDIAVSNTLAQKVAPRIGAEKTNKLFGLTDQGTAIGIGAAIASGAIDMGTGIAIFTSKKVLESPTFQLYVAEAVNKLPLDKIEEISKQIKNGKLNPQNNEIMKNLLEDAYEQSIKAVPVIRSTDEEITQ